ncbi:tRNA-uridine aminocarboxypropyltransferase [Pseudomonas jilinensis]|uniref:tRNA-uridine aminocarboxypropyltransferase n=1 Tax=Pseudomonas jilinensis TaxID=2078689 RepID=A0A396RZ67_9PSED|nr:DTW domain-containing protein [Pseudomonas jilinensis]RHW21950.1 DTW domain-containing protein [Pseudomonas jilinensis]
MTTLSKRPRCQRCQRPLDHCLCPWIPDLESRTRVLIIQHPSERQHALNTARLLALGLRQCQLLVVERLDEQPEWQAWLRDSNWRTELLFPGPDVPLLSAAVEDSRPRQLVLLDGTWRKARKLLYLNPLLQELPRVALPVAGKSRYRLRKAPSAESLATIEAGVLALSLIEPQTDFSPLLKPFERMIEGQIQAMGLDTYHAHHPHQ